MDSGGRGRRGRALARGRPRDRARHECDRSASGDPRARDPQRDGPLRLGRSRRVGPGGPHLPARSGPHRFRPHRARARERSCSAAAVPRVVLSASPGTSLATLVDAAARELRLRRAGTKSAEGFDAHWRRASGTSCSAARLVFVAGRSGAARAPRWPRSRISASTAPTTCRRRWSSSSRSLRQVDAADREDRARARCARGAVPDRDARGDSAGARGGHEVELIFLDSRTDARAPLPRDPARTPALPGRLGRAGDPSERQLSEVASLADRAIDTSQLNVHQLKAAVVAVVSGETRPTVVNLVSFGFRYGTPESLELLLDVRFLPNPYFDPTCASAPAATAGRRVRPQVDARRGVLRAAARLAALPATPLRQRGEGLRHDRGRLYRGTAPLRGGGRGGRCGARAEGREVSVAHRDVEKST